MQEHITELEHMAKRIISLNKPYKSTSGMAVMVDRKKLNNELERLYLELHNLATPETILYLINKNK